MYKLKPQSKVLVTGGTGLIGTSIAKHLINKGVQVNYLSRSSRQVEGVQVFLWDIENESIDERALDGVEVIIHLAGANVGQGRWTESRKKELIQSRVNGSKLLVNTLSSISHQVKVVVAASGIGLDPQPCDEPLFINDLAKVWEASILPIEEHTRLVVLRIGMVLSNRGGALKKLVGPVRLGLGAAIGNGDQQIEWIHIEDLCRLILFAIEEDVKGIRYGVAPIATTNYDMIKKMASILHRPLWLPKIPGRILELILGEQASIVTNGKQIADHEKKWQNFKFRFESVREALIDLLTM